MSTFSLLPHLTFTRRLGGKEFDVSTGLFGQKSRKNENQECEKEKKNKYADGSSKALAVTDFYWT